MFKPAVSPKVISRLRFDVVHSFRLGELFRGEEVFKGVLFVQCPAPSYITPKCKVWTEYLDVFEHPALIEHKDVRLFSPDIRILRVLEDERERER